MVPNQTAPQIEKSALGENIGCNLSQNVKVGLIFYLSTTTSSRQAIFPSFDRNDFWRRYPKTAPVETTKTSHKVLKFGGALLSPVRSKVADSVLRWFERNVEISKKITLSGNELCSHASTANALTTRSTVILAALSVYVALVSVLKKVTVKATKNKYV